jgi:hypothetical protein
MIHYSLIDASGTFWGVGRTEDEARTDAERWLPGWRVRPSDLRLVRITPALSERILSVGGDRAEYRTLLDGTLDVPEGQTTTAGQMTLF